MADLSIDEAKAKMWVDDVAAELKDVEVILKNVSGSLTTPIVAEDTIMQGIYNVGTSMENAWTTLCNEFVESTGKIAEAVSQIGKAVIDIVDVLTGLKNLFL